MLFKQAIQVMQNRIVGILYDNRLSIYLYGSVALNDFKPGWSDIDILCLTGKAVTEEQASRLLNLRQELEAEFTGNKYFRAFEGGILALNTFVKGSPDRVVYWGSNGQSITDEFYFDSFCMAELIDSGILLYGNDIRDQLQYPTEKQLKNDIAFRLKLIRNHAVKTERSFYSAGWLFDIARGLYTLRTGKITAKTTAGEWALENNLCPDAEILETALKARKEPEKYKDDEVFLDWAETLGIHIQRFADVLERELNHSNREDQAS
jgi:predicted nucleotidyltransferase